MGFLEINREKIERTTIGLTLLGTVDILWDVCYNGLAWIIPLCTLKGHVLFHIPFGLLQDSFVL